MILPLEGIKVIELGTHVVIPNISRIMADWGAQVIKVESPTGDLWRNLGLQYSTPATDEENPIFAEQNANKKFVSINLKDPEGVELLKKMISSADIFMSNVRMKSLSKMGLGYDKVKTLSDKLIYVHFSGYGDRGEDAPRPGFDLAAFWARSGTMCDWVNAGDFPFRPPGGYGDAASSSLLMNGVLAALIAREKTGKGTFVTSSLFGSGLWLNQVGIISAEPHHGNVYPKSKMKPANPFSHIYKCKDENWLIITAGKYATDYVKCCEILGMKEYINDERYNNLKNVAQHIEEFVTIINEKFLQKDRDEWSELFTAADIVNEKLMHSRDVIKDPQGWANGYFRNVTYPNSGHVTTFPTVPVQLEGYPVESFELPGEIGRDTKEIMLGYGYSEEDYTKMKETGAIK